MAKRRAVDDDDDVREHSPTNKRSRTRDLEDDIDVEDEEIELPSTRAKKPDKGKGKRRQETEDDDGDEEPAGQNVDEDQFETMQGEAIRAKLENNKHKKGSIADHGIIESLEMHNFMCHKYLTFTFGPQINFIIGHNGSGKSAVLTALTVALGGKANSTGRGTGLKSFIREGQSVSEVSVQIKNQGEEAYKPREYGKSIVITRRFTKDGASTWKIRSKDGRVISTKREELAAICDHMNIQVDNPMNVLTQDAARQFLSASTPGDKYKLFLRGTQLAQLAEEYEACSNNVRATANILVQKKDALPDLRAAYKEVSTRFEEAKKARDQRHKADELKKELAWAHVAAKEQELHKMFEQVAKAERRIPKAQELVDEHSAKLRAAEADVVRYEADHEQFGTAKDLEARQKELNLEIKSKKDKLRQLNVDRRKMNDASRRHADAIRDFDAHIAAEEAKIAAAAGGRREAVLAKLEQAKEAVGACEAELDALAVRKADAREEAGRIGQTGAQADAELEQARAAVTQNDYAVQSARETMDNRHAAYGRGMPRALEEIRRAKWHGDVPLGPFGMHVTLRDMRWAPLLRQILGPQMLGFKVTDARDRAQLKAILERNKLRVMISVSGNDMFDYSMGEPAPELLTILRALEVKDPYVLRALINMMRIERRMLFETRAEAQTVLRQLRGGGEAYTLDLFNVINYGDGGEQSRPLSKSKDQQFNMLFQDGDPQVQLRRYQEERPTLERALQAAQQKVDEIRQQFNAARRLIGQLEGEERTLINRLRKLKSDRDQLQEEANVEVPVSVQHLVDARKEVEDERDALLEQFRALEQQLVAVGDQIKPLVLEENDIVQRLQDFDAQRQEILGKIDKAVEERLKAQKAVDHYKQKMREEQATVAKLKEDAEVTEATFQEWTAKASEYCDRFENPRTPDEVKRLLDSVQKALEERKKRDGASVEEMAAEVNKAATALENAQKELHQMAQLNKALRHALATRTDRWHQFRRYIALRTKFIFQHHLANRGYWGKVMFDHEKEFLHLKVATDDLAGTQNKEKDPKSLSGGEKSFSTICLLLALWEAIGCPIRCLDEFDVFMDAVNRRIAMRMMIDTANASDQKQYILITPQDMNNVRIGPSVRVNRMTDPERGQGTLAFST